LSADIRRRLLAHIPGSSDKNLPIGRSESPRYIQLRLEAYNASITPILPILTGNFGAGSPEAAVSETAGPLRLRLGQALHFASVGMTLLTAIRITRRRCPISHLGCIGSSRNLSFSFHFF